MAMRLPSADELEQLEDIGKQVKKKKNGMNTATEQTHRKAVGC